MAFSLPKIQISKKKTIFNCTLFLIRPKYVTCCRSTTMSHCVVTGPQEFYQIGMERQFHIRTEDCSEKSTIKLCITSIENLCLFYQFRANPISCVYWNFPLAFFLRDEGTRRVYLTVQKVQRIGLLLASSGYFFPRGLMRYTPPHHGKVYGVRSKCSIENRICPSCKMCKKFSSTI